MRTSLLQLIFLVCCCQGARILGSVFTPSYSHQVAFQPLWRELSSRGHELVLLTTDPMEDPDLQNVKEINLKGSYEVMEQYGASELLSNPKGRGYKELFDSYLLALSKTADWQLSQPDVQTLISNQSEHFDLIMVEIMFPTHLALVDRFNAPFVGIFSLDAVPRVHKSIGNFMHPVVYPDYIFSFTKNLTFLQRLISVIGTGILNVYSYFIYKREDETVKKYFGNGIRPLAEIEKDVGMIFINANPLFHQLRPAGPNTVQIGGGSHLKDPQPLPKELQDFMDSAKGGVIYFSLGTNVKGSLIDDGLKSIIVETLGDLPYKILWKFEEDLEKKPSNVKIMTWVPQMDVLQHPNVVLFITQGGLQSMEESIYSNVPMVAMPFFGDQPRNSKIMEENGLGVVVNRNNLTKEVFKQAIEEVISKPIYREKIKEIAELTKDVEMTGLEKAVRWTEYAIRTKGAKHLRNPIVDLPFYKLYLLDVIAFVFVVVLLVFYATKKTIKFLSRIILRKKSGTKKKKE